MRWKRDLGQWRTKAALGVAVATLSPFTAALPARAEAPEPIALAWQAPAGCPPQSAVLADVAHALGGAPKPTATRWLRADARVSRPAEGRFRVRLVTDMAGSVGEREFEGPTCAAVAHATALIVALTFDPDAVARHSATVASPSAPAPDPRPPPPAGPPAVDPAPVGPPGRSEGPSSSGPAPSAPPIAAPPTGVSPSPGHGRSPTAAAGSDAAALAPAIAAPPRPPPTPPTFLPPAATPPPTRPAAPALSSSVKVGVGAWVGGSTGMVPGLGLGAGGSISLLVGRLRFDVMGGAWPSQNADLANHKGVGGSVSLVHGGGRGCYGIVAKPVELAPCVGLDAGTLFASGYPVARSTPETALWIAPAFDLVFGVPVRTWLVPTVDAGLSVPLTHPSFVLTHGAGTTPVYPPPNIAGQVTLGVEARF